MTRKGNRQFLPEARQTMLGLPLGPAMPQKLYYYFNSLIALPPWHATRIAVPVQPLGEQDERDVQDRARRGNTVVLRRYSGVGDVAH
jgi:hypothetical protein